MLRGTQMRAICRTMRQTQGAAKAPPVAPRYVPQRSSASSPPQGAWSLSQSWLKVDGDIRPLTLETAVLQICDQDNAASAGASSVLALHCSGTAHPQWSDLAESLRRQRSDAVTRYERGGPPEAPIWSTPRAICAPSSFGCGNTSPWPGEKRAQTMDDHVRLIKSSAAAAHSMRNVSSEGLDSTQYIALLKDLGMSTKRLETHFFEGHSSTTLEKSLYDESAALGVSMERLGQLHTRHATTPAVTASAPPRWRLIGCCIGGAIAVHAATEDAQFAGSLDALVLVDPHAFALLADPRCADQAALGDCLDLMQSLLAQSVVSEGKQTTASTRHLVHEVTANIDAINKAAAAPSRKAIDALAALRCPKHVVLSHPEHDGPFAHALAAVSQLLTKHAGFTEHRACAQNKESGSGEGGRGSRSGGGGEGQGADDLARALLSSRSLTTETMPLLSRCLLDMC